MRDLDRYKDQERRKRTNRARQARWHKFYREHPEDPRAQKYFDRQRRTSARIYSKYKTEAQELFGSTCLLCGHTGNIHLHEIHGKRHPSWPTYALAHKTDFVALCSHCHKAVHRFMMLFGFTWEDILILQKQGARKFMVEVMIPPIAG